MQTYRRLLLALSAASLFGCGTLEVASDAGAFDVDPALLAKVQAKAVALENGARDAGTFDVKMRMGRVWSFDLNQLTETSVTMLGRSMERRGISVGPEAAKKVVLSARPVALAQGGARINVRVAIIARFADGTAAYAEGDGGTFGGGVQRATDHGIQLALQQLLAEPKFIAYLNQ